MCTPLNNSAALPVQKIQCNLNIRMACVEPTVDGDQDQCGPMQDRSLHHTAYVTRPDDRPVRVYTMHPVPV